MKEITEERMHKIYFAIGSFLEFLFCFTIGIFYLMFYKIKDFVEEILKRKENAAKKEIDI